MRRSSSRAVAMVFGGLTALVGCASPPGPDPTTPAPTIPEEAVAYDDIKSLEERPYPFTGDCSQFDPAKLRALGLAGTGKPYEGLMIKLCTLDTVPESPFSEIEVQIKPPPNPSVDRVFPTVWNGQTHNGHFRRDILLDRYYAVKELDLSSGASCAYVVDTGSAAAIKVVGGLEERRSISLAERIRPPSTFDVNVDEAASFMSEYCPRLREITEGLLPMIDPDGGSLATQ